MTSSTSTGGLSLFIDLSPEGDGGAYRIKNAPGEINRSDIVDRGDSLVVQADLIAAIHGKAVDKDTPRGGPATLIVTDFWFSPGRQSRRFTWARITFTFHGEGADAGPSVTNVAPKGHFSLHPMPVQIEKERSAEVSLEAPVGPVVPGASFGWALKKAFEKTDQVSLSGITRLQGRDFGPKNTAIWTLMENSTAESGIPTRLRTAILLKRKTCQTKFRASVNIEVDADLVSKTGFVVKRLLGKIPKDDPVVFDSAFSLESEDVEVNNGNLGEDLDGHCRVETTTRLRGDGTLAKADEGSGKAGGLQPKSEAGEKSPSNE
ncbi:hypothetical protein SAMD00023353_1201570 [Rosellinia necatrix]|uniref:Uncharacterized protein n=1 Tax=Rosellinia necatrix TaxID=77044 RepID=A0A1W2TKG6_ROSNE|nr:hypothetical protein SAMD00023353_1201570 [Rosellinia necatrix]